MLQEEVLSTASGTLDLWGAYSLADPLVLAAIPVVLVAFLWGRRRSIRSRGLVGVLPQVPRTWRQRLGWLPAPLQLVAVLLATVALARPLRSNVESQVDAEGVDIALLVDRSGSMQFDDLEQGKSRLEVVKEVVGEFAVRRMSDDENAADSCALITFARYPRLLCPFTLDVDALQGFLEPVELVQRQEEDGTAIGVALAKAVAVLRESQARSRIAVLLTDGENNVEDIAPRDAAELAAEEGVKVYTVFAARYNYQYHPFKGWVPTRDPVDTQPLQEMAELTGGQFYRASDRQQLEEIYAQIEELEKTPRSERRFEETHDLYPWFLIPALALAFVAQLSRATWARRVA
jgi:Ca-activated chloride channel family protein